MADRQRLLERLSLATRHVTEGRRIITRHNQLIAQLRDLGADTTEAEILLRQFEETQRVFEDDCASILKELSRPDG
jgi:hypothetical protein